MKLHPARALLHTAPVEPTNCVVAKAVQSLLGLSCCPAVRLPAPLVVWARALTSVFEAVEGKGKPALLRLQITHFYRTEFAGFREKSGWLCEQHGMKEEKPS